MLEFSGIAVSPGLAVGKALILDREGYRITRTQISPEDCETECERLDQAVQHALAVLQQRREQASGAEGAKVDAIFSAHQQVLLDPVVRSEWQRMIREELSSAEYAVSSVLNRFAQAFRQLGSEVLVERAQDIRDVEQVLLEALGGEPLQLPHDPAEPFILLSHDLTPGETARLDRRSILGFCTEAGGPGGHTAIVARGLDLPAVVALGPFLHRIEKNAHVILDGHLGKVYINPTAELIEHYRQQIALQRDRTEALSPLRELPAETSDGRRITMLANIEFPGEVSLGLKRGAEGVGLYRTEFLFLGRQSPPDEEDQLAVYRDVVRRAAGRPVIMRTLDLGCDKVPQGITEIVEENPMLGLRSIRFSLQHPELLRVQIRAMLRAAADGPVRIMFPMIATMQEWHDVHKLVRATERQLRDGGWQPFEPVQVGMMLEVPSAVLMLEQFAKTADFFSIGTNDLIQYTIAVDRVNKWVANLYSPYDPAVLRLIHMAVQKAEQAGRPIHVCGEMSSTPGTALLLIGLGVKSLSAPTGALPTVKQAIRQVRWADCKEIAERALQLPTSEQVQKSVQAFLQQHAPEFCQQEIA